MNKKGGQGERAEAKSFFTSNLAFHYPLLYSDDDQNSHKLTCFYNFNPLTVLRKSNHKISIRSRDNQRLAKNSKPQKDTGDI